MVRWLISARWLLVRWVMIRWAMIRLVSLRQILVRSLGLLILLFNLPVAAQAIPQDTQTIDIASTDKQPITEVKAEPMTESQIQARIDNPTNVSALVPAERSAVVSLRTKVTGNQEQPQVLYILPWQSPQANIIDFELLDAQASSVFGHVERHELRRELEANGEFD